MSSARSAWRLLATTSLVLAWSATSVAAQDPAELARIRVPLEAAQREYARAQAAWNADSVQRGALPITLAISGMTIASDSSSVPASIVRLVADLMTEEMKIARTTYGSATDSLLSGVSMSIVLRSATGANTSPGQERLTLGPDIVLIRTTVGGRSLRYSTLASAPIVELLRRHLRSVVAMRLNSTAPKSVAAWAGGPAAAPWEDASRSIQYRQLKLAQSPVAAACLTGALPACRVALAIVPPGQDTVSLWFDANAQRARVRAASADTLRRKNEVPAHIACVRAGDDSACRRIVGRLRVPSPTGRNGRSELLRRAIAVGGEGAWDRLRSATTSDIDSLLVAVSGVPTDSLIAAWRADVLLGRPPAPTPSPRAWFAGGVACVLLLGATVRQGARP